MNKSEKSEHADLLNRLVVMQESLTYAARRDVLVRAETLIVSQEARINQLENRLDIIDGMDGITRRDVRIAELEIDRDTLRHGHRVASDNCVQLENRVAELKRICGESYQVVGALANAFGMFDDPQTVKALDNLSQCKLVHGNVLPFIIERCCDSRHGNTTNLLRMSTQDKENREILRNAARHIFSMQRLISDMNKELTESYRETSIHARRVETLEMGLKMEREKSAAPAVAPSAAQDHVGYLNIKYGTFFKLAERFPVVATGHLTEMLESGEIVKVFANAAIAESQPKESP